MKKFLIELLLVILIAAGVAGYFQYHVYEEKLAKREDAMLYFHEQDYEKAITYFSEALKLNSMFADDADTDMICYMAESYYQLEEYDQAIEIYNQLLKNDAKNSMYYLLKGECYEGKKDYEHAIEVFEAGFNQTKDTVFLSKICNMYLSQKDYENALVYAKKGIEAKGKDMADFMYDVVVIYEKAGDYQAAYDAVCDYCEKYPEDERAKTEQTFLSTRID